MKALGLGVALVLAGVVCVVLGLFGVLPSDAMGLAGMALFVAGAATVLVRVGLEEARAGRRGRFG